MKEYQAAAEYIRKRLSFVPEIALVLGSGLGDYAAQVKEPVVIAYKDIPGFPVSTVMGHAGELVAGNLSGKRVVLMRGRVHYYEGNSIDKVVFPVRALRALGAQKLILTNAAGGINTAFEPGTLMLIRDHINLTGINPLIGPNDDEAGLRFPSLCRAYDTALARQALEAAESLGLDLKQGVYYFCTGPSYETPAEIRAMRFLGADAVGMSTVPEAIAAVHMGMRVAGISCITNMAAGVTEKPLHHEEVMQTAAMVSERFKDFLNEFISRI